MICVPLILESCSSDSVKDYFGPTVRLALWNKTSSFNFLSVLWVKYQDPSYRRETEVQGGWIPSLYSTPGKVQSQALNPWHDTMALAFSTIREYVLFCRTSLDVSGAAPMKWIPCWPRESLEIHCLKGELAMNSLGREQRLSSTAVWTSKGSNCLIPLGIAEKVRMFIHL